MIRKIIPTSEFVIHTGLIPSLNDNMKWNIIYKYSTLMMSRFTLGMFVPCSHDGNVLTKEDEEYKEAKKKVFFNGFTWDEEDEILKKDDFQIWWVKDVCTILKAGASLMPYGKKLTLEDASRLMDLEFNKNFKKNVDLTTL